MGFSLTKTIQLLGYPPPYSWYHIAKDVSDIDESGDDDDEEDDDDDDDGDFFQMWLLMTILWNQRVEDLMGIENRDLSSRRGDLMGFTTGNWYVPKEGFL